MRAGFSTEETLGIPEQNYPCTRFPVRHRTAQDARSTRAQVQMAIIKAFQCERPRQYYACGYYGLTQNHTGCESERFAAQLRSANLQSGQAVRINSSGGDLVRNRSSRRFRVDSI